MKNKSQLAKDWRKVQIVVFGTFLISAILLFFSVWMWFNWLEPKPGLKVTFDMFQDLSLVLKLVVFELLPTAIVCIIWDGIIILWFVRKHHLLKLAAQTETQTSTTK